MTKALYLVMDQGGHSTRALVYNTHGECITITQLAVDTSHPQQDRYEQDPRGISQSLQHCLQQLDTTLVPDIISAVLVTQRSSFVACRKDSLEPLTPVISWQDTRNRAWLQTGINSGQYDLPALKLQTGLRLNAHYGASKIRWLLDHDTAVQVAAHDNNLLFLPLAAYLTQQLTHQPAVIDAVTASRTFLVGFGEQKWSDKLLKLFDIPAASLPTIVPTRHAFGDITVAGRKIPLQVVGGDQSFLPFAYGKTEAASRIYLNAGTGAFVQTTLPLADTPAGLLCSVAALDDEHITVAEGTVNACASALDWLFEQEGCQLSFTAIGKALNDCRHVPVFYHRVTALGSPYWLPADACTFSETASFEEKTVAVIESIVFLLAINIDLLKQAKPALAQIVISGGFSRLDGFCQKLADCSGLEVIRCEDHEASARGAACYLGGITDYAALSQARHFRVAHDAALLARYQHFHLWLRSEWLKIQ